MKPTGMTATFQIIEPNRVQDAIYAAVEEAILKGWSVQKFRAEAAECWSLVMHDAAKDAERDWAKP